MCRCRDRAIGTAYRPHAYFAFIVNNDLPQAGSGRSAAPRIEGAVSRHVAGECALVCGHLPPPVKPPDAVPGSGRRDSILGAIPVRRHTQTPGDCVNIGGYEIQ